MGRGFTVLVAEENTRDAQQVADAVAALALPFPVHLRSGMEAVAWIGAHECDACVVDYGLRDLNGLETMLRIHQRKPNLPVVLTSRAQSEEVAIAAFHAGVTDYVPKKRGYAALVADVIHRLEQQALRERSSGLLDGAETIGWRQPVSAPRARLAGVNAAEPLLQSTYQNRLRAIGRELDTCSFRSINLSQVVGGFHVRTIVPGRRTPEVLVFSDPDIQLMIQRNIVKRGVGERGGAHPRWLPTGYEDFLRALGHVLDQRKAEAITITEFESAIAVGGVALLDHDTAVELGPFQELWHPDDIDQLLNGAFRRRGRT